MRFRVFIRFWAILLSTGALFGKAYYVAPDGDDANPGSLEQPFATIQHAATLLKAGDICCLRGGRYHEAAQITGLNGRQGQPITIQPYKDEKVMLDGSVRITTEWSRYNGQIFKTRLDQDIWQLFVDDETMISARWPNARWKDGSIWDQEKTWAHQSGESTYGHMVNDPAFQDLAGAEVDFTHAMVLLNIGAWNTFATKVKSHEKGSGSLTLNTGYASMVPTSDILPAPGIYRMAGLFIIMWSGIPGVCTSKAILMQCITTSRLTI